MLKVILRIEYIRANINKLNTIDLSTQLNTLQKDYDTLNDDEKKLVLKEIINIKSKSD